jgi:subtilisin family serine protease
MRASTRFRSGIAAVGASVLLAGGLDGTATAATQPNLLCEIADVVLPLTCTAGSTPGTAGPGAAAATAGPASPDPASLEAPVRGTSSAVRYDARRLNLTLQPSSTRQDAETLFARAGVQLEHAIPHINAYVVAVEPARRDRALRTLRRSTLVVNANREPLVEALAITPDDADWPQQWGLRVIGLPQAWALTRGSSRVVVAVLDTGVDSQQPELRNALVPGYDFVNSDTDPRDDHGHGTAVAGIVGARSNNGKGIAGVCWNCSIMPVKVLNSAGLGDESVIAAGIVWAVDHGARVINLSLGGPGVVPPLTSAIAYATGRDVAVVAAAGNNGANELMYPAADPLSLSVAATTSADKRYTWSNFGSWVRVAAPGCNIAPLSGGGEGVFCGTSSATPVVAGLVALAYSVNPAAVRAEIEDALETSAVPVPTAVLHGRVNAPAALSLVAPRSPVAPARTVRTVRGRLGPEAFTYPLNVGAGLLTARLTASAGRASLLVYTPDATTSFARATGRKVLRLQATVPEGALRFVVRGTKRGTLVLKISYAQPGVSRSAAAR